MENQIPAGMECPTSSFFAETPGGRVPHESDGKLRLEYTPYQTRRGQSAVKCT